MSRRRTIQPDAQTLLPLEATAQELEVAVATKLGKAPRPTVVVDPEEPGWVSEALLAAWPRALAEADAAPRGTWYWP